MFQFKSKNSHFWKWILYCGVSLFIIVVGWSIYHMTPGLWPIALAMCGAGAAVSFVYTVYTTVIAKSLRRKAWICEALIVVGLAINVTIHAAISRRYDVAIQAREARYIEEEREQEIKEAEHKRQTELLDKQKSLIDSQTRQLGMLPTRSRRSPGLAGQSDLTPQATPIIKTKPGNSAQATVSMLSPEQIQEQAWWWVLGGILCEVGFIVGTFIYFVRGLIGDVNKNGVEDWKEELDPEELRARFPDDYNRLHGGRTRQTPGMAPAYAQSQAPGANPNP